MMRYGAPCAEHAYWLALQHLRQPDALDVAWLQLRPDEMPTASPPTMYCTCAARAVPDAYGHVIDAPMRSLVRLRTATPPADLLPLRPQAGDARAYLIGRCHACGRVWWAPQVGDLHQLLPMCRSIVLPDA